jgi:hypothetical protein
VMVVPRDGGPVRYYEEIPVAFIHDSEFGRNEDYYVITLEYGHEDKDLINPVGDYRPHKDDPSMAHMSPGLHPIVRRYSGPTLVAEHHVLEDLYADWCDTVHSGPLLDFFQQSLGQAAPVMG